MLYKVVKDMLPSAFSGRVYLDKNDQELIAQFTLSDSFVTILPLTDKAACSMHEFVYSEKEKTNQYRWFYGISDSNTAIAFLQNSPMRVRLSSGIDMRAGYFYTPLMVHGSSSMIQDISEFNAIEFYGDVMDYLYNPGSVIEYDRDQCSISFNVGEKNRHEFEACINGEKVKVIFFIRFTYEERYDLPDLQNNISSVLRFEFEDNKSLDNIEKYYTYALRLFQFCTGRLNVRTNICLFNSKYGDALFFVRYRDGYLDYATEKMQPFHQIILLSLGDKLPKLLTLLNDEKLMPKLDFLPSTNECAELLSYTQVIDLCSSFEKEYEFFAQECDNELGKAANELADKLIDYICEADVDDTIKSKACGIISGNLKHFKPSLKKMMIDIYDRYKNIMRQITGQSLGPDISEDDKVYEIIKNCDYKSQSLTKSYTNEEFEKKIRMFSDLRGSAAHSAIKWNGGEDIFIHLVLLIYFSILDRAGYNKEDSGRILSWLFYHRFL